MITRDTPGPVISTGQAGRPVVAVPADNLLVIDFETAYDKKYSLRKMTVPEYVADQRYKTLGVALRYPGGRLDFRADVGAALKELTALYGADLGAVQVVCHNAYFDLFILNYKYGIRPKNIIDTMLLAYHVWGRRGRDEYGRVEGESAELSELARRYGLGEKGDTGDFLGLWELCGSNLAEMRAYAEQDARLTAGLATKLAADVTTIATEMPLLAHTVKLYTERCIHIDLAGLRALRDEVRAATQQFLDAAKASAADVGGNKNFAALLEKAMAATGRKIPLKEGTRGPLPATAKNDPQMLALCEDDDPIVAALANARVKRKSQDQLLARLGKIETVSRAMHVLAGGGTDFDTASLGRVPVHLVYYGARTGRWSGGGGINFQNMGRTGFGKRVRNLILPAPGCVFVVGDLASIEARVLAWVAGQAGLTSAYIKNSDVYSEFAARCFATEVRKPKPADAPDVAKRMKSLRGVGKIAILGLGYGMGALKHLNQLRGDPDTAPLFDAGILSPAKCTAVVKSYRADYPEIPALWAALEQGFRRAVGGDCVDGGAIKFSNSRGVVLITLPNGRALRYPRARLEHAHKCIDYLDGAGHVQQFATEGDQIVYGNGTPTYGGKVCENIVQAIARDILAAALLRMEASGHRIVMHVHDELVAECPRDTGAAVRAAMETALTTNPDWSAGLPLAAEVDILERYDK